MSKQIVTRFFHFPKRSPCLRPRGGAAAKASQVDAADPAQSPDQCKTAPAGAASLKRPGLLGGLDAEDARLGLQRSQALVDCRHARGWRNAELPGIRGRGRTDEVDAAPRDRPERQCPLRVRWNPDRLYLEVDELTRPGRRIGVAVRGSAGGQSHRAGEEEGRQGFHGRKSGRKPAPIKLPPVLRMA